MSVWSKIRGTIETIYQIGLGGPQIKNNSGALEMRNSSDTTFVITRGLTPVAANDYATKAYVDSGGASGAVQEIRFAIGTGASQASATSIPASAYVTECTVEITTPYSGGTTISVGQTGGSATLFQLTTDNLATANGLYTVNQDTLTAGAPATVSVTIAGAPAAGVGVVIVKFSETLP
jgi:hypothetical protein